eukprot:XP_763049.1 hypothetical protein [Theileria parva strain Muguga]
MKIIEGSHTSGHSFNLSQLNIPSKSPKFTRSNKSKIFKIVNFHRAGLESRKKLSFLYNINTPRTYDTFENIFNTTEKHVKGLCMTRKVRYGYRYNSEKVRKKGTVRSKIYFDMWKDKNPYYVIHKFLYENDPDNKNFNYDIDLARKVKCKRNIFAHYKKDNKLRFFWYASRKNYAKGPVSRYINFALDRNEFRFSKLHSYFHILPYVHQHYKDDPRYIYFMNRFLGRHGRIAQFKRMLRGISDNTTDSSGNTTVNSGNNVNSAESAGTEDSPEAANNTIKKWYSRDITWKEVIAKGKREEEELYSKFSADPIRIDLGNGRSFTVKPDGFKVHGEYYSKINKKNRATPYDIYSPFLRTKHSSRRRRYREKIPLDPSLRFKTRRERILHNAKNRNVKDFIQKYIKKPPKK